jgi:hypothetical protein
MFRRERHGRSSGWWWSVRGSPLGVLKRDVLRFSPALPPDRLAAIERLGFGRYEKVALRFDEPFWRAAGLPHAMIFPRDPVAEAKRLLGRPSVRLWPNPHPARV